MSHTCPRYQPDWPRSYGTNLLKNLLTSYIYIKKCRVMGTEMRPRWALNAMHK
ncbi:hypothetical protein BDZ94DRAFT_1246915 [Collybia nuda]|uniref:Uncharacterized protein n=1 Tax=Collybia nuda TaxID=64659 RepID=A0A9P5YG84_9AGAR|nr:hypothetical protein BDZ94DRAFT_1246915 [Collybia nuda]